MAVRQLRLFSDPILYKRCKEVKAVDDAVRALLDDMVETLHATENGAGLAACQVGILKRLVVIDMGEALRLVNPRLAAEEGTQECTEGCLSFPGRFGRTIRPMRVTVEALNERGEPVVITGEGELAKCLCHELDHLEGICLPNRVTAWSKG